MTEPWYATREDVKSALDSKETARNDAQVDRAVASASRGIDALCHRRFYPWTGSRSFPWPDPQMGTSYRLWLDDNELVAVTALQSGGVAIGADQYFLEPANSGPPFTRIELDLGGSASFGGGATAQRDIEISGVFGYRADESPAGALAGALDGTAGTVAVTNSAAVGVGSLLRIGSERLIVTGKTMTPTGQTLQADIDARASTAAIPVANGAAFAEGETVLVDAERMRILDVAGNTLIVKRAWDGSALAAHTTGAVIYAPRTLTLERAAVGTSAASHANGAAVFRHDPPALVRELCIAEALVAVLREGAGYATRTGSGDNARETYGGGLPDLREQVYTAHGRKVRKRVI
ncbi:hypothetical protein [Amycolatopsis thermoflava]|uniref:hypothetical protein n=1 Tax=Amycolatopsis thermoflava TaxID=84480 RepID=UPI0003F5003C|nr:hypothetical protein [Amycolatopsis thermoflava]